MSTTNKSFLGTEGGGAERVLYKMLCGFSDIIQCDDY